MSGRGEQQPIQHEFQATGARISYFEWGSDSGQQVVLLHATGFHARCWDVSELLEHLEISNAIGAGHSMGGHCLTQVAATHPGMFQRLLLIDPVILPPEAYSHQRYSTLNGPEDHPVAKRKGHWRDWHEMFDRFVDRLDLSE